MRGADKTWSRRGIAAVAAGLAWSVVAAAAEPQQAAGPMAQAPSQRLPTASGPAQAKPGFRLQQVTFTGASAVPQEELQALAAGYVGRDVSLADLEALAAQVTELYRGRGYFLAQALVPVQTVREGRVEISVVEGRLGKVDIQVAPDAPISEARVRAYLAPLQPGQPVSSQRYERAMLLLSDLPGIKVSSGLQEGAEPGTTDLVVEVVGTRRVTFAFDADNHGTRESGRVRVGGTMRVASPLGLGDNLDARLMMSEGNSLNFGRLAYEAPLGADGLRLGAGVSRVRYELGQPWSQLGARGRATVADLSLNYPVIRQRNQNLFLRLGVDHKDLRDDLSMFSYSARKNVVGAGLGWSWERRDDLFGGGYWASTGTLYHGRLDIEDDLTRALDQGPAGHQTNGGFTKLTWQVSRLQSVLPRHTLYVSLGGQFASGNLDASEKLALGGARAVRAFPSGELLVDEGVLGVVEWRWAATEYLTPYVFYDVGKGRMFHSPTSLDTNNTRSMQGFGIGAVWSRPGDFMVNVSLAWRRNTAAPVTDGGDRKPRIFVQFQKVF